MSDWDDWDNSEWPKSEGDHKAPVNEPIDELHRIEVFTYRVERQLREIAIDFGMQFEHDRRSRIESLIEKLRFCLRQADEQAIAVVFSDLSNEVYEINRAAYLHELDDDGDAASAAVVRR